MSPIPPNDEKSSIGSRRVALDTGPLLCFGHINGGIKCLLDRYHGRLCWTEAVVAELGNHARRSIRRKQDEYLGKAAQRWLGPEKGHLGVPHAFEDRTEVENMRSRVQVASKKSANVGSDLGESETLLLAQKTNSIIIINENAGRKVAKQLRLQASCTLDVLVAAHNDRQIEFRKLKAMYEQMRAAGLDPGDVFPSPLSSQQLQRWPTPAPA